MPGPLTYGRVRFSANEPVSINERAPLSEHMVIHGGAKGETVELNQAPRANAATTVLRDCMSLRRSRDDLDDMSDGTNQLREAMGTLVDGSGALGDALRQEAEGSRQVADGIARPSSLRPTTLRATKPCGSFWSCSLW